MADEVVVCDTGSTDGTLDILRSFGCRVVHFEWCNDFAKARNVAISAARGDYLFWADADEEISESAPGALRALCNALPHDYHGYMATVICPNDESGLSVTQADQFRIWRNHMGLRFEGMIHEQLMPPGGPTANRLLPTNAVSFFHWGYTARGEQLAKKWQRNREMLAEAIQRNPESYVNWTYMGRQLCWEERWAESLPYLLEARRIFEAGKEPEDGLVHSIYSMTALTYHKLGLFKASVEVARTCPPYGVSSESEYLAGTSAFLLGDVSEAIYRLTRACSDPKIFRRGCSDPASATWRPRVTLAEIAAKAGDYSTAIGHLETALKAETVSRPDIRFRLAEYSLAVGQDAQASEHFREILVSEDAGYKQRVQDYLTAYEKASTIDTCKQL